MNNENTLTVYSDGGARGNPGPAAAAFIIYKNKKEIFKYSKYLGKATNNEAEYNALLSAISWIWEKQLNDIKKIIFYLDSQLIVRQLNGSYKVKQERLKFFVEKIRVMENNINKKIIYVYVPREKNKNADLMVNKSIDENLG
jgi:ribonuclease HI